MNPAAANPEWIPRPLAVAVLVLAAGALVVHAYVGFQGSYLTYGSGIWLTMARDLAGGVLYRDLSSELGFGGTRYFPLFFSCIAALLKAGVPLLVAGWLVAALSLILLAFAVRLAARLAGAPAISAWVFGAAAAASYFAQQTAFEIKADVLAAALNAFGVAFMLPAWRPHTASASRPALAGTFFSLAFATKVTAVFIPAALIAAAVLTGRRRETWRLGRSLVLGMALVLVSTFAASQGRAFRVWSVAVFGGADAGSTLAGLLSGVFLSGVVYSHLLWTLGIVSFVGFLIAARAVRSGPHMPVVVLAGAVWLGASLSVALVMSSPGTVPTNQVIEWTAITFIVLAILSNSAGRARRLIPIVAVLLLTWMSFQDLAHARSRWMTWTAEGAKGHAQTVERIRDLPAPVVAESALWPVLAGREVIVPDAFAARVVFAARPDLAQQFVSGLDERRYSAIVLEFDALNDRGIYDFSHFGTRVIDKILLNYQFSERTATNAFLWLPRR